MAIAITRHYGVSITTIIHSISHAPRCTRLLLLILLLMSLKWLSILCASLCLEDLTADIQLCHNNPIFEDISFLVHLHCHQHLCDSRALPAISAQKHRWVTNDSYHLPVDTALVHSIMHLLVNSSPQEHLGTCTKNMLTSL